MDIKKNILLRNYTTFKIGGRAKYFFIAKTKEEIVKAVKWALAEASLHLAPRSTLSRSVKEDNLPFFILGGGNNLLVSDKGYRGLVIKIQNSPKESLWLPTGQAKFKIICAAGVSLTSLVSESSKIGVSGLEWAAGIPGTVGGAIYGNAGAFKYSMADVIKKVEVLEIQEKAQSEKRKAQNYNLKLKTLKNKDCCFGYRDSIFKKEKNLIILSAELQLKKGDKKEIQKKINEYLNYRKENQPLNFPSAGSIFKNFQFPISNFQLLIRKFPEIKQFKKNGIIPTAWLIEKCGLKGKKIGKAKISEKHANFIVNLGGATAKDVKKLINFTKKAVKKKFKINLEEEIQYLGF